MKKIILGSIIVILLALLNSVSTTSNIIPDAAIRLRVLANSNSKHDQEIKDMVKKELQTDMYSLLNKASNVDEARGIIKRNINNFKTTVSNVMSKEEPQMNYLVDYGIHYFPKKVYKGVTYKEGNYESVLVKLGEGKGDNWWCVLFPPLCLLEAEETTSEVEYKFFVQELIDKFF